MSSARSALSRTCVAALTCAALVAAAQVPGRAQGGDFVPVTDAMLQDPDPLDELVDRSGQSLFELCACLTMKHGTKLHWFEGGPLKAIAERWPISTDERAFER